MFAGMRKLGGLIFFMLGLLSQGAAQSMYHPWIIGISGNFDDFHVIEKKSLQDRFTSVDWMGVPVPAKVRLGHRLNNSFTFSLLSSVTRLEPAKLNTIPLQETVTNDILWQAGGQLEYRLANGYLLHTTSPVDPYLLVGANATHINDKTRFSSVFGLGINFWLTTQVGVNFQSAYDHLGDFNDFMHYSFGIVARVGHMADKDRDGVPNRIDHCPAIAGVEGLNGYPDYDGDGITDSLDACPRVAGLPETDGCPDFDKDGIPDHLDECPGVAGPYKLSGCPDRDGDGVIDRDDHCPFDKGTAENNGCPVIGEAQPEKENPSQGVVTLLGESQNKQPTVERERPSDAQPAEDMASIHAATALDQHKYHIIVGSFVDKGNAVQFKTALELKGYRPRLVGQDRYGSHRVSIGSYDNYEVARRELKYIRQRITPKAWLLIR